MRKLGLIYNPVSGHALFKGRLDWLIDMFQRHGMLLCPYRTRGAERDDIGRFLREVHPDGVVAAGGDGTVHAVVNAMREADADIRSAFWAAGRRMILRRISGFTATGRATSSASRRTSHAAWIWA